MYGNKEQPVNMSWRRRVSCGRATAIRMQCAHIAEGNLVQCNQFAELAQVYKGGLSRQQCSRFYHNSPYAPHVQVQYTLYSPDHSDRTVPPELDHSYKAPPPKTASTGESPQDLVSAHGQIRPMRWKYNLECFGLFPQTVGSIYRPRRN